MKIRCSVRGAVRDAWSRTRTRQVATRDQQALTVAARLRSFLACQGPARVAAAAALAVLLSVLFVADTVAGSAALLGVLACLAVLRRRSPGRFRGAAVCVLAGFAGSSALLALGTYDFSAPVSPLLVVRTQGGAFALSRAGRGTVAVTTAARAIPPAGRGRRHMEVLGFVESDVEDSSTGVDRDLPFLSELGATGITLGQRPGTIVTLPPDDAVIRAHINDARGDVVVSNWEGQDFNGSLATAHLGGARSRGSLAAALRAQVVRSHADGVVLDLENLPAAARALYPAFVTECKQALGPRKQVMVAVPAADRGSAADLLAGYDLAALGRSADRVVWMAYDEHTGDGEPGPVASLSWVRDGLGLVTSLVPRGKVLLGVAGYGYSWPAKGPAATLTASDEQRLARERGARQSFDPTVGEVHLSLPGRGTAWYSSARSVAEREQLAAANGLAGVALWRVGSEDPQTFPDMNVVPVKSAGLFTGSRRVEQVAGRGAVALTFDDGPDPTWTPRILDVLRRKGVPATFFDIGKEVLPRPDLARQEVSSGSVVGDHTYTHPEMDQLPAWRIRAELAGGQMALEGATGLKPVLYRAPYGSGDRSGSSGESADTIAGQMGMHQVDWSDDPNDWRTGAKARQISDFVVAHVSPRSIVLLHDGGGNRSATVAALPGIIDRLRARGYRFVTADMLDGGVQSPYAPRHGLASRLRGVLTIVAFRIGRALWTVLSMAVLVLAAISMARLAVTVPLAVRQARLARRRARELPSHSTPTAVVIPAHNEQDVISKTLISLQVLAGQDRPDEIIVVDDGSTDETARIVAGFPGVRLIGQPNGGKAAALNTGIAASDAEVVVVVDADTVVTPGLVPALGRHFADPRVGAVAGNVKVGNLRRLLPRLQAVEYAISLNLDRRAQDLLNTVAVVPGAAGAFRRAALDQVGGYPSSTLVEDADLTVTLLRAGWRIPYEPAAVAWTEAPERVRHVLRQRRRWAFGTVQVCARHADALLGRHSGRVGLLGLPWTLLSQIVLPLAAPVMDLYLLWILLLGGSSTVIDALTIAAVADIVVATTVLAADHCPWWLALYAPLLRWIWRPLQVWAVLSATHEWMRGEIHKWRPSIRYDSLDLHSLRLRRVNLERP